MTTIKKEDLLDINQICNKLKLNKNSRSYIEHKYKGKEMSLKQWKDNFKKDGLSY